MKSVFYIFLLFLLLVENKSEEQFVNLQVKCLVNHLLCILFLLPFKKIHPVDLKQILLGMFTLMLCYTNCFVTYCVL